MQKFINACGKSVLIIGDLHFPYTHIDYLAFLKKVKSSFLNKNSIVISIGDELDYHAVSFHDSIAELLSAGDELEKALSKIKALSRVFPKMFVLESNHGSLLFRRMKKDGIPIRVLKSLKNLYQTPDWEWHNEIILETNHRFKTYICHGKTGAYNKLSREVGMNAIQGHFHSKFEITWQKTATHERYNAFTGCLVDGDSLAFEYGKNHLPKPIHGCLVLGKDGQPHLIKMVLNSEGRWNGKLPKL